MDKKNKKIDKDIELQILGAYGKSVVIVSNSDIKRLREIFHISQKDLAEDIGVSRPMITQLESGKKPLSDNMKDKLNLYFTDLKREREELTQQRAIENDRANRIFEDHTKSIKDKEQYIKDIEIERKSKIFNPSINASFDMVWMTTMLDGHRKQIFEQSFLYKVEPNIEIYHNPNFDIKGSKYLITIHCKDVKITLRYGFKEKGMGAEVFNKLVVQFNPNKADMDNNQYLGLLFWILGDNPIVTKFDVCKDYVGLDMGSLYVSNAQRKRNYQYINNSEGTTHYLGDKNNNGVMIYDKTKELLNKDSKDIGYDVIRYEHRRSKFGGLHLDRLATELDCIDLPTLSAYNKLALMPKPKEDGATEIEKFDYMTFATASMILEGRIDSKELKASNRYQYKKVMEYLEDMSLANLSLSHIEIVRAIEVFAYRYQRAYAKGLKVYEDIMLNTKVVTVSEENIQRGADALIGIMERSGKGASDKLVDRLRNGKEVKVFGKDENGNNVVVGTKRIKPTVEYTQTMLPMNDTKYF